MKRSKGTTTFCVVLGLLALAGFGDSIVMLSGQIDLIPRWLGYLTLVFGITAGGAAAGLWRTKRWGLHLLRAWFVACFTLLLASSFVFNSVIPGGIALVAIVALVLAALFLAIDRHVSSNTEVAT